MHRKRPNPDTWRPKLNRDINAAFFELVERRNKIALQQIGYNEWLVKMIYHWWKNEFPDRPFPAKVKEWIEDFDI
jgi:hypothetical protein